MKAIEIASDIPIITVQDTLISAVRVMVAARLPGLVVVDSERRPKAVIPGTEVLRTLVLRSFDTDSALVRAIDEAHADTAAQRDGTQTVGDCLPTKSKKPLTATQDATLLELAELMLRGKSQIVAIIDPNGILVGAVTFMTLLSTLASRADPA